jgi:hypothetical protein
MRSAFWAGFWFVLLFLPADLAQAQMIPAQGEGFRSAGVIFVSDLTAPPEYARWYAAMERCLGMKGDYAKVQWYSTPAPWSDGRHGNRLTYGLWRAPHKIVLNAPGVLDSMLVSHEVVHDIVGTHGLQSPERPHPTPFFGPTGCAAEFLTP